MSYFRNDLPECPFCKTNDSLHVKSNPRSTFETWNWVACGACDCQGPSTQDGKDEAIRLWSERGDK